MKLYIAVGTSRYAWLLGGYVKNLLQELVHPVGLLMHTFTFILLVFIDGLKLVTIYLLKLT